MMNERVELEGCGAGLDAPRRRAAREMSGRPDPGTVDVWDIELDVDPGRYATLLATLDAEECERAGRFRRERDRRRFVAAHGALREVLGAYLGVAPRNLVLEADARGKPRPVHEGLHFNLSHSGDRGLVAVAGCAVGVDLEKHRALSDLLAIAARYFSMPERRALETLDPARRGTAFFRLWTAKEAIVKTTGAGISSGLDRFAVRCGPNEPDGVAWAAADWDDPAAWSIRAIDVGPGYSAAVAVRARLDGVRRFAHDASTGFGEDA